MYFYHLNMSIKLVILFTLFFSIVLVKSDKTIIDIMDKAYLDDLNILKDYSVNFIIPVECPYASLQKTTGTDGKETQEINTDCLIDSEEYGYYSIRMIRNLSDKTIQPKITYSANNLSTLDDNTKEIKLAEVKQEINNFLCKSDLNLCQIDNTSKFKFGWTYDSDVQLKKYVVFCDYVNSQTSKTYKVIYSWYKQGFRLRFLEERNTSVISFYVREYEKISYLDYEKSYKKYNYDKPNSKYTLNTVITNFSAEMKKYVIKNGSFKKPIDIYSPEYKS
jgi:hypothetical protein